MTAKLFRDIGLCGEECMGKTWPYLKSCIRPHRHKGQCQGIENGMTETEALAISQEGE